MLTQVLAPVPGMLRAVSTSSVRVVVTRVSRRQALHTTSRASSHQPNAPLDLDPSFRALMSDVDLSLLKHKNRHGFGIDSAFPPGPRELEVFPSDPEFEEEYLSAAELDSQDEVPDTKEKRKSPAALFGSKRFGAVVLPLELQDTITRLVAGSDKPMLHTDAKRLFMNDGSDADTEWDTSYATKYKSRKAASRHEVRDGTAFASIAFPAHYSAIYAVLDHVKLRLGPSWNVEHIVDWGAGTGSALWASLYSFPKTTLVPEPGRLDDELFAVNSSVASYLGIDKRDGLVSIGKKLAADVDMGATAVSWKKTFHGAEKPIRTNGEIVAISAFMMSALPTPLMRKAMIKEMWESEAETIILIDHGTHAGFSNIAEAREFLLKQGRKEPDSPDFADTAEAGCHVIAPCPHDGACPIYFSGSNKVVCNFSQRLQRPEFLRKTKHTGVGHEDVGYSYVVIRRGPRPPRSETQHGRIGEVGRREQAKEVLSQAPVTELVIDGEHLAEHRIEDEAEIQSIALELSQEARMPSEELEAALRAEAYSWPRLVFPPLKKAGHIILDGCTEDGKIMRMTVPKSQGKQPFYDARKSDWGDMFPHDPKNRPQIRFEAQKAHRARNMQNGNRKKETRTFESKLNSELEKEKGKMRLQRKIARLERDGL